MTNTAIMNATLCALRTVYALVKDRKDDSSKRLCVAINDWITENA